MSKKSLAQLKNEADAIGVKYYKNISTAQLEKRIQNAQESQNVNPKTPQEKLAARNTHMRNEAQKLIRCRITCMNPMKKNWPGEIVCVRNKYTGTIKKYIPFNLNEPFHIPHIIFKHLKNRECQTFIKKDLGQGKTQIQSKLVKEFSIEELPPLTAKELKELAAKQAARIPTND